MIYTHVLNLGGRGIHSPADRLGFDLERTIGVCRNRLTRRAVFAILQKADNFPLSTGKACRICPQLQNSAVEIG